MRKSINRKLAGFNLSLTGSSHIAQNKGCDDCSAVEKIRTMYGKTYLVLVSADGVGHCRYAAAASRTVVDAVVRSVKSQLLRDCRPGKDMVKRAFCEAVSALEEKAAALGEKDLKELGTTLDVAILLEDGRCYVGHSGDGGMLILTRSGKISTTRKINTDNGAVYAVDWESPDGQHAWAIHALRDVVGVLLATDGLYDYFTDYGRTLDGQFFKKHGIFSTWKTDRQVHRTSVYLQKALAGTNGTGRVTRDDITLVMGGRQALMTRAAAKAKLA